MPGVEHRESVARGGYGIAEGAMRPDGALVHTIEGWQHVMARPDYKANSYHLTFRQDGWTIQHVSVFTPAWHAGRLDSAPPTWPLYRPGVNPNAHSVGLSAEGAASAASNPNKLPLAWTPAQVDSAVRVLRWLGPTIGVTWDARTLSEHSQVAVLTRLDPGPRWPKAEVLRRLTEIGSLTPEQAEVVANIRAHRDLLTDADVTYILASVGLSAMPGGEPTDDRIIELPEVDKTPIAAPTLDRAALLGLLDANARDLAEIDRLTKGVNARTAAMRQRVEA